MARSTLALARQTLGRVKEMELTPEEKENVMLMITKAKASEEIKDLAGALREYNNVRRLLEEIGNKDKIVDFEGKKMRKDQLPFVKDLAWKLFNVWLSKSAISDWRKIWVSKEKKYLKKAVSMVCKIDEEGYILELFLDEQGLPAMPKLPEHLKVLLCSENELFELPDLPDSLEFLDASGNHLTVEAIKKIKAHKNSDNFKW
ncbi:MAG: hypothetical protein NT116_01640 [Candidatus Parcubacteria bacterium]|nr:hypothetical protein [Candidatus Parcubacteria bacterium]